MGKVVAATQAVRRCRQEREEEDEEDAAMAAQEKKGILRLMAEVVWRPKHDEKRGNEAEERNQSTIRPEFMIQRRVSTESLPRIPRTLKDIIEDPQHMADFEAYLKELDIDIDKDMCGFLDCFHFFVRIGQIKVGDSLNISPWTRWFPEDVRGHRGLQLAIKNRDHANATQLRRNCAEAIRSAGGIDEVGLNWLKKASLVCLDQLTLGDADSEDGIVRGFIIEVEKRLKPSKLKKAAMCFLL